MRKSPNNLLQVPTWQWGIADKEDSAPVKPRHALRRVKILLDEARKETATIITPAMLKSMPGAAAPKSLAFVPPPIIPPHLRRRAPMDPMLAAVQSKLKMLEAGDEPESPISTGGFIPFSGSSHAVFDEDLFTPEKVLVLPSGNKALSTEMSQLATYYGLYTHELPGSLSASHLRDYYILDAEGTPLFPRHSLGEFITTGGACGSPHRFLNTRKLEEMHQHFTNILSKFEGRQVNDLSGGDIIPAKNTDGQRKVLLGMNQLMQTRQFLGVAEEHGNLSAYQKKIAGIWKVKESDVIAFPKSEFVRLDKMLLNLGEGLILLLNFKAFDSWYGWNPAENRGLNPHRVTCWSKAEAHAEYVALAENAKRQLLAAGFTVIECINPEFIGGIAGKGANNRRFYVLNRPQDDHELSIFINSMKQHDIQVIVLEHEQVDGIRHHTNYLMYARWPG